MQAPVVVFAYKRPGPLQRMLGSLAANPEAAESSLFIFCDGPKVDASPKDLAGIKKVRELASAVSGFKAVEVVTAERNKGLARSVIEGVTHAVDRFGRAIIVEDDAVLSAHFLRYMNAALSKFANAEKVWSIGSWNYFADPALVQGNFFYRYPDSLAWATWKRSWDHFEKDGDKLLAELKERGLTDRFDADGQVSYFSKMLKAQVKGTIDSWAIRWTANCILHGGLNYFPRTTLSQHEGHGEDATHEKEGADPYVGLRLATEPQAVVAIPIEESKTAIDSWTAFVKFHFEGGSDTSVKGRVWQALPQSVQAQYLRGKRKGLKQKALASLKSVARRAVYGRPSEEDLLIAKAAAFPRYTPTTFTYQGWSLRVTDMLSVAWQIKEFFGEERMKFHVDGTAPVIVDCGANVGVSILYYKSCFPEAKVLCFEPDAAVRACLEANMKANGITDISCRPEVVWVNDRGVSFGSEGADGGSILRTAGAEVLPSVRLKDVLIEARQIDLLKVDIEGAESDVLLDCGEELKRVKYLYVEYHSFPDRPQTLGALLGVLRENGFRYYIHRIGVHHKHPFAGLEQADMDLQLDIHAIRG